MMSFKPRMRVLGLVFVLLATCLHLRAGENSKDVRRNVDRAFHLIDADLRTGLKSETKAKSLPEQAKAVRDLVSVYGEIMTHSKAASSPTLDRMRIKLKSRLRRVQKQLAKRVKRTGKNQRRAPSNNLKSDSYEDSTKTKTEEAGRPGGGPQDDAQILIELIQRTISPDTWDVSGGSGAIRYFARKHALVVRAPAKVHGEVGGLLQDLRDAGQ